MKEIIAKFLEGVMKREVAWYDYEKMDKTAWQNYFNDAQYIVKNEVFNNELDRLITDLTKFSGLQAKDWEEVITTRASIIALETFKERLESIKDPRKIETKEEIYEPI